MAAAARLDQVGRKGGEERRRVAGSGPVVGFGGAPAAPPPARAGRGEESNDARVRAEEPAANYLVPPIFALSRRITADGCDSCGRRGQPRMGRFGGPASRVVLGPGRPSELSRPVKEGLGRCHAAGLAASTVIKFHVFYSISEAF